jgi:hypothetical protein
MHDPSRDRYVVGVDPARPGSDRTEIRLVKPEQLSGGSSAANQPPNSGATVTERWNRDPVAFARDIGLHLDRAEEAALRAALKDGIPGQRRQRRVLDRVRRKIERALQRIHAATVTPAPVVVFPEADGED